MNKADREKRVVTSDKTGRTEGEGQEQGEKATITRNERQRHQQMYTVAIITK